MEARGPYIVVAPVLLNERPFFFFCMVVLICGETLVNQICIFIQVLILNCIVN